MLALGSAGHVGQRRFSLSWELQVMPPASRVPLFLLVFAVMFLMALIVTISSEFSDVQWIEKIVRVAEGLGRLTFVSIAITFILVEGIPMLAAWYKKQMVKEAEEKGRVEGRVEGHVEGHVEGREEGLEEGLEKGRAQNQKAWHLWLEAVAAWEQRKAAVEGEGRIFTDPRPSQPSDD